MSSAILLIWIAFASFWLYLLLFPAPAVIETDNAGGHIYFSANRQIILNQGDCVTLRWQVDRISAVYLNGQAQIGSGEVPFCLTGEIPTLRVIFQDNSEQIYTLNILTLLPSPLTWLAAILTIIVVGLHWHHIQPLFRQPARLAALIALLILMAGLLITFLIPNVQTIATANWLDASNALVSQITGITLLILLAITAFQIIRTPSDEKFSTSLKPPIRLWGIGLLLATGLIAGTIIAVNPLGMYGAMPYPSYQLLIRGLKTDGYNQLPEAPDIAIMGSSRAFTLSPTYIHDQTGHTAYNMAVEGGRIEDILIQARTMHAFPKVMLIEIQEGLRRQPNDIAARAPLNWLPYMSSSTALLTIQKRLEGLLDVNQFAQSIYTARYAPIYNHQPREWPEFAPDGEALRPPISASELERAILVDIGNIPAAHCDHVDDASQTDVNTLLSIAVDHHTSLVFYISPWNPRYYDALLKDDPQYQTCHAQTVSYMQNLAAAHDNLFFLDYAHLDGIDGIADETGYYDSQHLTTANSQRLIDHLADTLGAAVQRASEGG